MSAPVLFMSQEAFEFFEQLDNEREELQLEEERRAAEFAEMLAEYAEQDLDD